MTSLENGPVEDFGNYMKLIVHGPLSSKMKRSQMGIFVNLNFVSASSGTEEYCPKYFGVVKANFSCLLQQGTDQGGTDQEGTISLST